MLDIKCPCYHYSSETSVCTFSSPFPYLRLTHSFPFQVDCLVHSAGLYGMHAWHQNLSAMLCFFLSFFKLGSVFPAS